MTISISEVQEASRAFCRAVDDLGSPAAWKIPCPAPQPVTGRPILAEGDDGE